MRNLILGISILCLALSGLITFKALTLPERKLGNLASQSPMKIHESSQVNIDNATQTDAQSSKDTIAQLEQKLENKVADSQMNILRLENTVKQLEQKLADKIANSQTDAQSSNNTMAQLEQKVADKVADSQMDIRRLENTVKQLEQELADKIANSQTDTQTVKNTTSQLEQQLTDKIADSQINIRRLESTVKQLEQKLAVTIANSQKAAQSAKNSITQPSETTASHRNTSQNISKNRETQKREKSSGQLLFSVSFDSGAFVITNSTNKLIQQSTQYIRSLSPNYRVIVEGHTDTSPLRIISEAKYPYKDNMGLSLFRAEAVAGMLEKEGISSERISTIGYGDTRPIATNTTEEGRAKNRRVVVRLIPEEKEI